MNLCPGFWPVHGVITQEEQGFRQARSPGPTESNSEDFGHVALRFRLVAIADRSQGLGLKLGLRGVLSTLKVWVHLSTATPFTRMGFCV